jgi:hypothetical protein
MHFALQLPPDQFEVVFDETLDVGAEGFPQLLQATAIDEFGHLIGLKHPQPGCSQDATIMVAPSLSKARLTLTDLDRRALAALVAGRPW